MKQVIVLGNGKQIPINIYVHGIKTAKENPDATFKHGLCGWSPVSGREIVQEFFGMAQDHCNRGLTISQKDKNAIISHAWKNGRHCHCRNCGNEFIRKNPFNDMDRFCSNSCRGSYYA